MSEAEGEAGRRMAGLARPSRTRPRSEIVESRSEKKALAIYGSYPAGRVQ